MAAAEGLPDPYLKALSKLAEGARAEGARALPERAAQQAERLAARFGVSAARHEELLSSLLRGEGDGEGEGDEGDGAAEGAGAALDCAVRLEWLEGGG